MKFCLVIFLFICVFYVEPYAQLEIGVKTGVQMLGMFRLSNSIFGDGYKTINPAYGLRLSHALSERSNLSLDFDFTSGNYYNVIQSNRTKSRFWRHLNYSLINTSVLFAFKLKKDFYIKSGVHIFFVGKIYEQFNGLLSGDTFVAMEHSASRAVGVPLGISFLKNNFEFELKWVGTLKNFNARELPYRRLETASINVYYNFYSKK